MCVCVLVQEYVDLFKASRYGDFGIHLLLMCYQRASFSNGAACETEHKTASLKSLRSQNSCGRPGPLRPTDVQESCGRQATPRSATATDSSINKDGHPSAKHSQAGCCSSRAPSTQSRFAKARAPHGPVLIPAASAANLPIRNAGLWLCLF